MAETNKSQLISEAELIEAINADSIISVSLGAGQPQKNVKLSTLASVVAGLIGNASYSKTGLMPSGYAYTSGSRTMAKGESYSMGGVEGLFLFQDIASFAHWHVMFKAKGVLLDLSNKSFGYLKLSTDGNNLVVTNVEGGAARQFTIIYQNVSLFAK